METKSRNTFLDLLRIIACFFVIINHTYHISLTREPIYGAEWFISVFIEIASKVAVPVFFMISGYLLLGRVDNWKKNFRRIKRIVITLISCAVIYATYNAVVNYPNVSLISFAIDIAKVYIRTPSSALWYLYAYLGILLMLPFFQKMASLMEKKDYYIFFAVSALFHSIIPVVGHYFGAVTYNGSFFIPLFDPYISMLFIGQYFNRFGIRKTKKRFIFATFMFFAIIAICVVGAYFEHFRENQNFDIFVGRKFIPVVALSVCLFYMASFARFSEKVAKAVSYVGECTFGIYLISDLFLAIEKPLYEVMANSINWMIAVLIFQVVVFLSGLIFTTVMKKIPYIKKIL